MSFGTAKLWRLCAPFIALLWAVVSVSLAGTAQADDSAGTDHQSSVATSATADAGSPDARPTPPPPPPPPPPATDHPAGPNGGTSGGTDESVTPQPISNADANTGGANGQCPGGPYCSTSDGTASGNGNGGGNATGEPCAGCVGKADNKNPHGQMPDASDHNAGYECDTNHGIARGNPAHSGCQSAPPQECVPSPQNPCTPPPPCVPSATDPCAPPPPCVPSATNPCAPPPPCVPSATNPCAPPPPACVTGCVSPPLVGEGAPGAPALVSPPQRVLPSTGAPAGLVVIAAAAVASILGGTVMVARGRRRILAPRT